MMYYTMHIVIDCNSADLHLGDAHVVSVDDVLSRPQGEDMVRVELYFRGLVEAVFNTSQAVLIVAQCREKGGGRLSGIKLSALDTGLQRVATLAHRKKGPQAPI